MIATDVTAAAHAPADATPSKAEVARRLAAIHYTIDGAIGRIYQILCADECEARPDEPVKLLEVNEGTVEAGIWPIRFGPHEASGIVYPTIIVEVTAFEFDKLQTGALSLPDGWRIGALIERPSTLPDPQAS